MAYQLSQLIRNLPLARDEDAGWMQLLIFAIVAVVYALAGLARARAQKAQDAGDDDISADAKSDDDHRSLPRSPSSSEPPPYRRPQPPRPPSEGSRLSQRAIRTPPPRTPPAPQSKLRKTSAGQAKLRKSPTPSRPQPDAAASSVDLSDPAKLQRAIIHYEVLSPCLALRQRQEHPSSASAPSPGKVSEEHEKA